MSEQDNNVQKDGFIEVDPNRNYIDIIKELKEKSVPKEDYDRLFNDNKILAEALANGDGQVKAVEGEVLPTIKECQQAFKSDMSNLEFCKASLALREAVMREKGIDIFAGKVHGVGTSQEALASAQRVADVMEDCIKRADGDSVYFTNELMRRTNDTGIPRR